MLTPTNIHVVVIKSVRLDYNYIINLKSNSTAPTIIPTICIKTLYYFPIGQNCYITPMLTPTNIHVLLSYYFPIGQNFYISYINPTLQIHNQTLYM